MDIQSVLEGVCCVYEEDLRNSDEARNYLVSRGVSDDSIRKFRLGSAPDEYGFFKKLCFDRDLLKEAGIVGEAPICDILPEIIDSEEIRPYHCFNHRITIPVFNRFGELIGFGGRALCAKGSCQIKYIDTAGKNGFNRGRTFYGANLALKSADAEGKLYVFEGYFDVILAHQQGLENCVALLGTKLPKDGLTILRELFPRASIMLCYDGDNDGHKAARKSLAELQGEEIEVFTLRQYEDPADLFKEGKDIEDYLVGVNS